MATDILALIKKYKQDQGMAWETTPTPDTARDAVLANADYQTKLRQYKEYESTLPPAAMQTASDERMQTALDLVKRAKPGPTIDKGEEQRVKFRAIYDSLAPGDKMKLPDGTIVTKSMTAGMSEEDRAWFEKYVTNKMSNGYDATMKEGAKTPKNPFMDASSLVPNSYPASKGIDDYAKFSVDNAKLMSLPSGFTGLPDNFDLKGTKRDQIIDKTNILKSAFGLTNEQNSALSDMASRAQNETSGAVPAPELMSSIVDQAIIYAKMNDGYSYEDAKKSATNIYSSLFNREFTDDEKKMAVYGVNALNSASFNSVLSGQSGQEALSKFNRGYEDAAMVGSIAGGLMSTIGTGSLVSSGVGALKYGTTASKLLTAAGTGAITSGLPSAFAGDSYDKVIGNSMIGAVSWTLGSGADTFARSVLGKVASIPDAANILEKIGVKLASNPVFREMIASTGAYNLTQILSQEGMNVVVHGRSDYFSDPTNLIRDTIINTVFDTWQGASAWKNNKSIRGHVDSMVRDGIEKDYASAAKNVREIANEVRATEPGLAKELDAKAALLEAKTPPEAKSETAPSETTAPVEPTTAKEVTSNGKEEVQAPQEVKTVALDASRPPSVTESTIKKNGRTIKSKTLTQDELSSSPIKTQKDATEVDALVEEYSKLTKEELDAKKAELEGQDKTIRKVNLQLFAEKVARSRLDIPEYTDAGKTRGLASTIYADETISQREADNIASAVEDGLASYVPVNLRQLYDEVKPQIDADPEPFYANIMSKLNNDIRLNAKDSATAIALLHKLDSMHDNRFEDLWIPLAKYATEAGQFNSVFALMSMMTPEKYVRVQENNINKLNAEGERIWGDKWNDVKLTDEEVAAIKNAKSPAELEKIGTQIAARIRNETPKNILNKLDSWRMVAMLFNPTTHIRNILGNDLMKILGKVGDKITAVGQAVFMRGELAKYRTKMLHTTKERRSIAAEDYKAQEDNLLHGNEKYENVRTQDNAFSNKNVIGKTINKLASLTGWALTKEDGWRIKSAYIDSLSQLMQARGIDSLDKVTDTMREKAADDAYKATFRQYSKLAEILNKGRNVKEPFIVRRNGRIETNWKVFGEYLVALGIRATAPFIKTPINIAKTGVEYSLANSVAGAVEAVATGGSAKADSLQADLAKSGKEMTEAEFNAELERRGAKLADGFERMGKGLSGTAFAGLAAAFFAAGWITGPPEDDYDRKAYEKAVGEAPYALHIPGTDVYYSIDWAQPAFIPAAVGITIANAMKGNGFSASAIIDAVASGNDALFNLPLLQSMARGIQAIGRGTSAAVSTAAISMLDNYFRQYIPSLGGKIASIADDTLRSTYSPKTERGVAGTAQQTAGEFLKNAQKKIPFASKSLEPQVDMWGRDVKQSGGVGVGGYFNRASQNLIGPGIAYTSRPTEVDAEIQRLLDVTKDNAIVPHTVSGYEKSDTNITYTDETDKKYEYVLTPKEFTQRARDMGTKALELITDIVKSKEYANLTDKEKAKLIADANADAREYANYMVAVRRGDAPSDGAPTVDVVLSQTVNGKKKSVTMSPVEYKAYKNIVAKYQTEELSRLKTLGVWSRATVEQKKSLETKAKSYASALAKWEELKKNEINYQKPQKPYYTLGG